MGSELSSPSSMYKTNFKKFNGVIMNIEKLLRDYNIPIAHPGDSNYREGWLNTKCPFCSDHSKHLGFNLRQGYAHCWRCGGHHMDTTISQLLGIKPRAARALLKEYGGVGRKKVKEVKRKIRAKAHKHPSDTTPMKARHKRYLTKRGFDPDEIAETWGVLGTGPISKLDGVDYKHRILAPIIWDGEEVSFQTRDITGKHPAKYLACPKDRELVHHQHILYGKQSKWDDVGIAVEGITDVWRLGERSFATFGISFTRAQCRAIQKHFRRVVIVYDDEPQAQKQSLVLQRQLTFMGVDVASEVISGDPGDLTPQQAKELTRRLW